MRRLDALDPGEIEAPIASSSGTAPAEMAEEGLARGAVEFVRQLDMRYVGQSYELTIAAPGPFTAPPSRRCSSASTPSTTAPTASAPRPSRSSA